MIQILGCDLFEELALNFSKGRVLARSRHCENLTENIIVTSRRCGYLSTQQSANRNKFDVFILRAAGMQVPTNTGRLQIAFISCSLSAGQYVLKTMYSTQSSRENNEVVKKIQNLL